MGLILLVFPSAWICPAVPSKTLHFWQGFLFSTSNQPFQWWFFLSRYKFTHSSLYNRLNGLAWIIFFIRYNQPDLTLKFANFKLRQFLKLKIISQIFTQQFTPMFSIINTHIQSPQHFFTNK